MLSRWPIRSKLLFGVVMLLLIVAILSISSFRGVYAYRQVVRCISCRSIEFPLAARLTAEVGRLRSELDENGAPSVVFPGGESPDTGFCRFKLDPQLLAVKQALAEYRDALQHSDTADPFIGDKRAELSAVTEIEQCLEAIGALDSAHNRILNPGHAAELRREVDRLGQLASSLPSFLQEKMQSFRDVVRGQYRTWIVLTWLATILTAVILVMLARLFYLWVFRPLGILIEGSRRVAAGDFDHRIQLTTHDEVAELADSMNAMTARFQQIRDDLDRQVQQRTQQAVRSERLASVGFLAAGVAHEINNPMASIAWCAESLESRLHEILHPGERVAAGPASGAPTTTSGPAELDDVEVLRRYLCRIQEEAFRCKGITDRLLDFARLGDAERQSTELRELVQNVIDMVQHLGKYREKHIEFQSRQYIEVNANPQEIKQVVLNLITNGLDSLEPGGTVRVQLERVDDQAVLVVADDGCGMSDDVRQHLFEPFFTRKKNGQGTGLGLSITHRIITDHGGHIEASSDGPGTGSRFQITLPLRCHEQETARRQPAA